MIRTCIQKLVDRCDLSHEEAQTAMQDILSGTATKSQIAAFITALRMKGETPEEIAALATTMKAFCHQIRPRVSGRIVDTCGTGGDQIKTFNISTTAAFVVAGAGVMVAKHGNRSFTSKSGSADVLEQLGVNLHVSPPQVARVIEQVGIGFMFAPAFHPAMKHVVEPRQDLGIRSVFNILGPLTNPAGANGQVVGVYDPRLVTSLAHALRKLGCEEAMVVHGLDGLDEISTLGKTALGWLREEDYRHIEVTPHDLGVRQAQPEDLFGGSPEENAATSFKILTNNHKDGDPKQDIVLVNAAAGIIVGKKASTFDEGLELARAAIASGEAYKRLQQLVKVSDGDASCLERLESQYG